MIILGIDPGLSITGFGVIKTQGKTKMKALGWGAVKTSKNKIFSKRLLEIHKNIKEIIKKYKPDRASVEKLYFAKNAKSAMKVGEARGVAVLALESKKIPIFEFTPLEIKQAVVGYGNAKKHQVQVMVKQFLKLDDIPKPVDAADALAAAITCFQTKKFDKTK